MKSMLVAFVAVAIIAVAASVILEGMGRSAQDATSGAAVRLDQPSE